MKIECMLIISHEIKNNSVKKCSYAKPERDWKNFLVLKEKENELVPNSTIEPVLAYPIVAYQVEMANREMLCEVLENRIIKKGVFDNLAKGLKVSPEKVLSCCCNKICELKKFSENDQNFGFWPEDIGVLKIRIMQIEKRLENFGASRLLEKMLSLYMKMLSSWLRLSFGKTRIDWKRVFVILQEKNRVLVDYKKYFYQSWIKKPVCGFLDQQSNLQNEKDSIVYIIFSTKTKSFYIGETKNLKARIMKGLRNAFRATREDYDYKKSLQYFEKKMGLIDFTSWNYAIIKNLGSLRYNEKNIRLRYEKYYINKLKPQLNVKGCKDKNYKTFIRGKRKNKWVRMKHRERTNKKIDIDIDINTTQYCIGTVDKKGINKEITTDKIDLNLNFFKHGHVYKITVLKKGYVLTNWDFVMNNIGSSEITPSWRNRKLESLKELFVHNKIKQVSLHCNKWGVIHNNIDNVVLSIINNSSAFRRELTRGSNNDILYVWAKIHKLKNWDLKRKALENLGKYLVNYFGTRRLPAPTVMYNYHPTIGKNTIISACKRLTEKVFKKNIAYAINESFRIVPKKHKSIKDVLANHIGFANQLEYKCAGPLWCKNGHFSEDLKNIKGCEEIGRKNANEVPFWEVKGQEEKNMIFMWLKSLLVYKYGSPENIRMLNQCVRDERLISIYYNENLYRTITVERLGVLWNTFLSIKIKKGKKKTKRKQKIKYNNREYLKLFFRSIDTVMSNYKYNSSSQAGVTPPRLFEIITKLFKIKSEKNCSPFDFNLKLANFWSGFYEDSFFGAKIDSNNKYWDEICFVKPKYSYFEISSAVEKAIKSAEKFRGVSSFLLLPTGASFPALKTKIENKELFLLCEWPKDTFRFVSPLTNLPDKPCCWSIGLFATNVKNVMLSEEAKKELTKISTDLFNEKPKFFEKRKIYEEYKKGEMDYVNERRRKNVVVRRCENEQSYEIAIEYYLYLLNIKMNINKLIKLNNEYNTSSNLCTGLQVYQVKRKLRGLVISPKDKNSGQLRVECPVRIGERMKKEIYDSKCFQISIFSYNDALKLFKKLYQKYSMHQIGRWSNGGLPINYTLPKEKDPLNKSRLIASYCNHPLKNIFQNVSRILNWMFNSVKHKYGMFTLFQLKDIKGRLKRAQEIINGCFKNSGALIVQTDVTKMYTNLCHDHILKDVIWLIEKVQRIYLKGKRKIRNDCKYIIISKCRDVETKKYKISWSNCTGTESEYTLTTDILVTIVSIDLKFCYQKQAGNIIRQNNGCPIGGFLSPIYANIKCARDEFDFMKSLGKNSRKVCGIRQVDDLFLCIAYDKEEVKDITKNQAQTWAKYIISKEGVYKGGLILEQQEYEVLKPNVTKHKFAGTIIKIDQSGHGIKISCKPLNKNEASLIKEGKQAYPKFITKESLVPTHYKKGIQITTYIRLRDQSSDSKKLLKAMLLNALEMYSLGFDTNFLIGALKHLALRNRFWKVLALNFLENLELNNMIFGSRKLLERTRHFLEREKLYPC